MAANKRGLVTCLLCVLVASAAAKQLTAENDLLTSPETDKPMTPDSGDETSDTSDITNTKPPFSETIYSDVNDEAKKLAADAIVKNTQPADEDKVADTEPETGDSSAKLADRPQEKPVSVEISEEDKVAAPVASVDSANKEAIELPLNDAAAATVDPFQDPCERKQCGGVGEVCTYDVVSNEAVCTCIPSCGIEKDPRQRVCSNFNITFSSECQLQRQVCLCTKNQKGCDSPDFAFLQLEYMGQCKEFKPCSSYEMEEYPKRMRDWLYVVMKEMGNRKSLNKQAMVTLEEAERQDKKWLLPVIWKFCDLDITGDRQVTFEELLPVSGPLKAYEHCTGPFISSCDSDKNQRISLTEWGSCLGLLPDEIVDMCSSLRV